jgi:hypothetical protein
MRTAQAATREVEIAVLSGFTLTPGLSVYGRVSALGLVRKTLPFQLKFIHYSKTDIFYHTR